MAESGRKSSTEVAMEAIEELHAQEQVVTRETLVEHTGLKMSIIDDRIKTLIEEGQVHRVRAGVFVPAIKHSPARAISQTILPDGSCKLEVGDDVLTLTPREKRTLGEMLGGAAMQFSTINLGHQATALASDINERLLRLERVTATPANEASNSQAKRDR